MKHDLITLRRRYGNARRRARFWSGRPSLSGRGPTGRNLTTGRMDEKYELAMCDCQAWEVELSELTGRAVEHYDPRAAFRARFYRLMAQRHRTKFSASAGK